MMSGFVYIWINKSNRKYYIGSHRGTPNDDYVGSGVAFKKAYKKNPELFERTIIYQGDDYVAQEDSLLKFFNVTNDKMSYNLKNDAVGGWPLCHTPEAIAKRISNENYKNRLNNVDWTLAKEKMVANLDYTKRDNIKIGKAMNTSEVITKRGKSIAIARKKPIIQMDINGNFVKEWPSAKDIRIELKINSVGEVLAGRQITAGGFKFKYK